MRLLTQIGLVLGLSLLIGLLVWQGFMDVLRLLLDSGWYLLLLPLAWSPVLLPATQGWRQLFRPEQTPTFSHGLLALWMGRAVNNLLPVATIGGEVVKARLLSIWGTGAVHAAASVMVDKAVQALALACWALTGALLLLFLPGDNGLVPYAVGGILFLLFSAVGLIIIQRLGVLGALAKLAGRLVKHEAWEDVKFSAAEADRLVRELYGSKRRILFATLYRLASLALHTFELWLALPPAGATRHRAGSPAAAQPDGHPERPRVHHPQRLRRAGRRLHPHRRPGRLRPRIFPGRIPVPAHPRPGIRPGGPAHPATGGEPALFQEKFGTPIN